MKAVFAATTILALTVYVGASLYQTYSEAGQRRREAIAMIAALTEVGRTCRPDLWAVVGQMDLAAGVRAIYRDYGAPVPPYGAHWKPSIAGAIDLMRCGA